jgi:hypothetical protein
MFFMGEVPLSGFRSFGNERLYCGILESGTISLLLVFIRLSRCTGCRTAALRHYVPRNDIVLAANVGL